MPAPPPLVVASIGDNCIDRYVGSLKRTHVGGNALNVAVGLARAGRRVVYAGAVGDDEDGRTVLAALAAEGIDARRVVVRPGEPTGACVVELRPDGERVFLEERVGASGRWLPSADDLETLRGCAWVHAAGLHADPGVLARLAGSRISLDMSGRPRTLLPVLAPHLELVFFSGDRKSRDDALGLARAAVEHGAGAAVVTRGSEGSLAFDGQLVERPAEPAQVVDTLGAGDALIVAVITARLDGATLAEALDAGSRAAALACSHYGAWTPA